MSIQYTRMYRTSLPPGPRTLCNACGLVYAKLVMLTTPTRSPSLTCVPPRSKNGGVQRQACPSWKGQLLSLLRPAPCPGNLSMTIRERLPTPRSRTPTTIVTSLTPSLAPRATAARTIPSRNTPRTVARIYIALSASIPHSGHLFFYYPMTSRTATACAKSTLSSLTYYFFWGLIPLVTYCNDALNFFYHSL